MDIKRCRVTGRSAEPAGGWRRHGGPTKMAPRVDGGRARQESGLRPDILVAVAMDPVRVDLWSRAWRQESWAGLQGLCGVGWGG